MTINVTPIRHAVPKLRSITCPKAQPSCSIARPSRSPSTACAVSTKPPAFDLDGPWQLHPQVSVRPERFGALLYHFGTRRLSFLKSPTLLTVVKSLGDA